MKQLLLSFAICCSLAAGATTYYASPSGTGNGNSYSTPCSFSNGLKKLKNAGDTLYLLSGQYNLGNTAINNLNGQSGKYIVIAGYEGINTKGSYDAILDFRNTAYGTRGLQVKNCTYLHIKNLTLRYSGKNNLYNEGSYCLFENLDIYGSADTGCQMKNGGNNIIKNVDSHDNFDYEHLNSSGQADFGGNADGFADKQFTGAGNHYIGCRAWNNSDDGWDFFQRISSSNTILENCICIANGAPYYDMRNHPRYNTDKDWFDSKVGTSMTDRYNQTITISLEKYPNQGNGNGFKMGGDGTAHNIEIHHCLSLENYARGFDQNNNNGTMWVYNCTAFNNAYNYGFTTKFGTNYLRNCISLSSKGTDSYKSQSVAANDHNTWLNGYSCSAADFLSTDTTGILSPRLSDGSLPEIAFMRLKEDSKLIDAGVEVGFAFSGTAPDLGCYEYQDEDIVFPATLTLLSGSLTQAVRIGNAITPVTIQWGGGAEDVAVSSNIPDGITTDKNTDTKTLTISGTPVELGSATISISTLGGVGTKSLTLNLVVKPAGNTYQIAYVTIPDSPADEPILNRLYADNDLDVTILDATQAIDYANADLIVISPVPASTAAGLTPLKAIEKPTLLLKPFMLKNTVWNWGTSANTNETTITVTAPYHPIFTGIGLQNSNQLTLFSSVNTNAVTIISAWNNSTVTCLATPVTADGQTIVEAPKGTNMNGTVIGADFLMIGVSEFSTANLTNEALTLINNACRYLLGLEIASALTPTAESTPLSYYRQGDLLILHNTTSAILYNITGQPVEQTNNAVFNISNLPTGIYLIQTQNKCTKVILP